MCRHLLFASVVLSAVLLSGCVAKGQPVPPARSLTVVVCDGLTWSDLEGMGEPISSLLRYGAIGLLSGSSLDLQGRRGVWVSLGSGRRAKGTDRSPLGAWLQQHGKSVAAQGNGLLHALLGQPPPIPQQGQKGEVTFLAVPPHRLLQNLQQVLTTLPADGCLWLVVPNSPRVDWQHRRLTPIVLFGSTVPPGMLTSPTTRQIGLVSSVDFAPTLLSQLRLPSPPTVTGRPMRIVALHDREQRISFLRWLERRAQTPLQNLTAVVIVAAVAIGAAILLTTFSVVVSLFEPLRKSAVPRVVSKFALAAIGTGMMIPTALFLVGGAMVSNHWVGAALIFSAALGLSGFAFLAAKRWVAKSQAPFSFRWIGVLCGITALVALLGLPLYWATPLGYFPTTGWRYFGITNSGIGLALVGTVFAWRLLGIPARWMLVWCLVAPLLMGFSLWGANFGGALTLAVGFAVAWEWLTMPQPSWQRTLQRVAAALIATVVGLVVLESWLPEEQQAHLGQLVHRLREQGWWVLTDMAYRKWHLMGEFFGRTPLSSLALALFVAGHLGYPRLASWFDLFACLQPAFLAGAVGAWVGLVVNDSGMEVVGMALAIMGGVFLTAVVEAVKAVAHQTKGTGKETSR